ncbi:ribosome biogenesis GTPase Der [Desulfonatronospira sp.]|uniref:ribosome biogenesis GTPase Der n=1 Tax=Desulfonatronospira sp. TaxID=1962951 RepID=UPI0025C4F956|nr:ribosome biogenesis GTPase Der [Desulfonatronospira sp.]
MLPFVVIVGRPNVGKSTLFNRLLRQNKAMVHDRPGVTRDSLHGMVKGLRKDYTLVDTGGLVLEEGVQLEEDIHEQVREAMHSADLVLFMVDGSTGVTGLDEQLASMLRHSHRPVHMVVNKVDGEERAALVEGDYYSLGFEMSMVSAAHGYNMPGLQETIETALPEQQNLSDRVAGLRLSLLGRPNVGKSSLINTLLGQERVLVSSQAGTTRDCVDVILEKGDKRYIFIDTAGVRRKTTISDDLERFSSLRAIRSCQRADVAMLVLDALSGVVAQDKKLLSFLERAKIPLVILVNKVDQIPGKDLGRLKKYFKEELAFCDHAPVIYTSCITRAGLGGLIPLAEKVLEQSRVRVGTGELNRLVRDAMQAHQPPLVKGRRAKIYYLTQPGTAPPEFVFFVNDPALIKPAYARYLEKQIRKSLKLDMTPVKLFFRASHK